MNRPSIAEIQKTVAEYYDLSLGELCGRCRRQDIVTPRLIAMLLATEHDYSMPQVARAFADGFHHTSVLHARRAILERASVTPKLERDLNNLRETLAKKTTQLTTP